MKLVLPMLLSFEYDIVASLPYSETFLLNNVLSWVYENVFMKLVRNSFEI